MKINGYETYGYIYEGNEGSEGRDIMRTDMRCRFCGFNGDNESGEDFIKEILLKLVKSDDSQKQIEDNIKTAITYYDKLDEAIKVRKNIVRLKALCFNGAEYVSQCKDNLRYSEKRHAENAKEYDEEMVKGKNASKQRIEHLKWCMDETAINIEYRRKTLAEAERKLDSLVAEAKKAGIKIEFKDKESEILTETVV